MKARLLYDSEDFDFAAAPPDGHEDLIQDLELTTLLEAMARGDDFIYQVSAQVMLTSLTDAEAIRYRQRVLADCIAEPAVIRAMYAVAVGALQDKRKIWGYFATQLPSSILSAAVRQLEVLISRLRELRAIADSHAGTFRSEGLSRLLLSLQKDLDDSYFETVGRHLRQLRFRDGVLLSAALGRDNGGIDYVLRSGAARRSWRGLWKR